MAACRAIDIRLRLPSRVMEHLGAVAPASFRGGQFRDLFQPTTAKSSNRKIQPVFIVLDLGAGRASLMAALLVGTGSASWMGDVSGRSTDRDFGRLSGHGQFLPSFPRDGRRPSGDCDRIFFR